MKSRLELTWIGKDVRPRLEPRILLEDASRSYHAAHRVTDHDQFDNRLIFGDNLLALKALEQEFAGKIKCIYIDPPYNTGAAFTHYDDGDLSEVEGNVPWTWWPHEEVGHTDEARKESQDLFGKEHTFDTAKPERLLRRVIEIATAPGEWVLDSFAGSGTTGAGCEQDGPPLDHG